MLVTYQDELGVVSVSTNADGVQFGIDKAYFTDENERDYTIDIKHLISIVKENE